MKIIFATRNLGLTAELVGQYADVELVGIYTQLADARTKTTDMAGAGEDVDAVVIDIGLASESELVNAIGEMRVAMPQARFVVITRSPAALPAIVNAGAETFVEYDRQTAAATLARQLGLTAKSATAKIITISGLQGGAGRTTVATGLAAALAAQFERAGRAEERSGVLLWELDLLRPTLAFMLDTDFISAHHGRRTIAQLLNAPLLEGDAGVAEVRAAIVGSSISNVGYDVLLAPTGIREAITFYQSNDDLEQLHERLENVLAILSRQYQAIVIDAGSDLVGDPAAQVALSRATAVCTVATPSPAGLRSIFAMRAVLGDLNALGRSLLVLNRVGSGRDGGDYVREAQRLAAAGSLELGATINEGNFNIATWAPLASRLIAFER